MKCLHPPHIIRNRKLSIFPYPSVVSRFNETKPVQLMTAEAVHAVLAEKAHRQWVDLAKAFRTIDTSSNGIITKRELRETLYKFMLPMSKEEFKKLWERYVLVFAKYTTARL